MEQLHLLYSYEEYKKEDKKNSLFKKYSRVSRLSSKKNISKEEEEELKNLKSETIESFLLEDYTCKTYIITDKFIELKNIHPAEEKFNDIINEIGMLQCDIEAIKQRWNNLNNK